MTEQTSRYTLMSWITLRLLLVTLFLGYAAKLIFVLMTKDSTRFVVFMAQNFDWLVIMPAIIVLFVPAVIIGGLSSPTLLAKVGGVVFGLIGVFITFIIIWGMIAKWRVGRLFSGQINAWQRLMQVVFVLSTLIIAFMLPVPDVPLFRYREVNFFDRNETAFQEVVRLVTQADLPGGREFLLPDEYSYLDYEGIVTTLETDGQLLFLIRPYDIEDFYHYALVFTGVEGNPTTALPPGEFDQCHAVREAWYLCARPLPPEPF